MPARSPASTAPTTAATPGRSPTAIRASPAAPGTSWASPSIRTIPTSSTCPTSRCIARKTAARPSPSCAARPGGDDYHQLWVDPKNSSHLILGTDQGTTISLNRGQTWSSWYNQPTAQFYHVITDNEFPYHVYGAQQDTGAVGVPSRTDHGLITGARLVHGGRRRERLDGARSQRSEHSLCQRSLWQRGALRPAHLAEPGHHAVADAELRQRDQPAQVSRSLDAGAGALAGGEERALPRHAVRDEDHRRRPALGADQSGPDRRGSERGSEASRPDDDRAEREGARLRRGVQHRAVAAEGRRNLGGQRHRAAAPHARRRQDLAGRHAARAEPTGARSR